jgi:hypothetical protein
MLRRSLARFTQLCSAIVLSGLLTCAQAAELGEAVVRSYRGQPLVADIELTALGDAIPAMRVRLARPDVYRGANIAMHPVLSSLNMSVMQRDGRQFLHFTSLQPVDAEHVHIFLELTEGSRRTVRGTTLWLTADPQPAPPPPASPIMQTPPAAAPAAPAALRQVQGPRPAACPQPFSAAQIEACATLDGKNAALTTQIAELEEKVKLLQVAIEGKHEPVAPPRAVAEGIAVVSTPPKLAVTANGQSGATPWLFIGIASAAILAVIGALVFYMMRRKKGQAGSQAPVMSGFMAGVKNRLMPAKKRAEPAPPVAEPKL